MTQDEARARVERLLAEMDACESYDLDAQALRLLLSAGERACGTWQDISTADKGVKREFVTDPGYVAPPKLLLLFADGSQGVAYWDAFYAEGGSGYSGDGKEWVEPLSGELYQERPTHWMPLPSPPDTPKEPQR